MAFLDIDYERFPLRRRNAGPVASTWGLSRHFEAYPVRRPARNVLSTMDRAAGSP
jgi:hypothetical protein